MNDYNTVGLYDHNADSYDKIKHSLKTQNIVSIVHGTGTGKSYNAIQLAYDNKDKKIVYVVPSNSIIEHIKDIIEQNPNLSLEKDFPNLEFRTYQSFVNMSKDEISKMDIDLLILDEFHHIGAPIWGQRIDTLVKSHPDMKIFGMTAYTVRDRGTEFERDMVNPEGNELFSKTVVSKYDLCDAMIDGVLPKPVYKSGYVYSEETVDALEERIEKLDKDSKDYKELSPLLKDIKRRLHEAPSVKDIFKTNVKPGGKYIYFCPVGSESGKNDIETIMQETKNWIKEMGLSEDQYEFYMTTSEMGEEGKKNRLAFYNDKDLNGKSTNNKLRIMFAINQYNEGVHAPGLDGVIMGRATSSDIVYFEQLGRALSVRGSTKEEYDRLYSKTTEELIELCNKRGIDINKLNTKEEIIEQLIAPTIIDLSNNIGFIKELENNLKDRVKKAQKKGPGNKRIVHLGNASFDINMINEDLFKVLEYMNERLTMTWMDKYNLAKAYYEHYNNLEVPANFKTKNGYDEDEEGISLGGWIANQRKKYRGKEGAPLTDDQIKLLENIGMRFENLDLMDKWMETYNLAKAYYEHYGDLEIPYRFKTKNGYDEDENGINLGRWIGTQRDVYQGTAIGDLTKERIELLEQIGMRFENLDFMDKWMETYNLAKAYYEHYNNLEVPVKFKTKNGYDEDENGINLGRWVQRQRRVYQGTAIGDLTKEKIELLKQIGMRFENLDLMDKWMDKYNLAKAYYEHNGNLEIPKSFITTNGYDEDENGTTLGLWIRDQRLSYQGKGTGKITEEQIKLLKEIGMRFENLDLMDKWMETYNLAKAYYEHYNNLDVPAKFKTKNGYDEDEEGVSLGMWIASQRKKYRGKEGAQLTDDQIKLLENIGMKWYVKENTDYKDQSEEMNDSNNKRKEIEILNRVKSYLNTYNDKTLPTKDEINQGMLDELNHKRKK